MIRFGASINSLVGWLINPAQPHAEQQRHLAAIRRLVAEDCLRVVELAGDYHSVYPTVMTRAYYEQVAALLRAHSARIGEIHLHDARREGNTTRDHLPLGAGTHPIGALLQALSDLNVAAPVVLEMNRAADLATSLEHLAAWRSNDGRRQS
jgi:L-ribulose-5-phosphate 3-epimerase UlaE